MSWKKDVGLRTSRMIQIEAKQKQSQAVKEQWIAIQGNRLCQNAKLFPCFHLLFTKMIVAHHNMVSIYDLTKKEWEKQHYSFEAPVVSIFRSYIDHENNAFEVGILLKNNTIRSLYAKESSSSDIKIKLMKKNTISLPGKIMHHCFDTKLTGNSKNLYMIIDESQ